MAAIWYAVRRGFPGTTGLAVWIAVTVPLPFLRFEATHHWEHSQEISDALWWTAVALPVLATVVGARCARSVTQRRSEQAFVTAVVAATLVSTAFLLGSLAFYRWVIPLHGTSEVSTWWIPFAGTTRSVWWLMLLACPLTALVFGAVGYAITPKSHEQPRRQATPFGYLLGVAVAVGGALVAPVTVQMGAEDSTVWYDSAVLHGGYGGVGANITWEHGSGVLKLPGPGYYAIFNVGAGTDKPDCRVTGEGTTEQHAKLITIQPGNYGSDYMSFDWVAFFRAPRYGTYSLTCLTSDGSGSYAVGDVPQIRGLVGELIHWPLVLIYLLGSIPGLLIIAGTIIRRARHADAPVFT